MLRKLVTTEEDSVSHEIVRLRDNESGDTPMSFPSTSLSLNSVRDLPRAIRSYRSLIRHSSPDLILAWMYHSCLFAQAATPKKIPVVWNVRHSLASLEKEKLGTRLVIAACARASARADTIIYCSRNAIPTHERVGFNNAKFVFIPNGFDVEEFKPYSREVRTALRRQFGIPEHAFVFGQAVRFHPMKNQSGLIQSFGEIARRDAGVHLVLSGRGITWDNTQLLSLLRAENLVERVTLLGLQTRMADVFNCFDAYVSTSLWGEGFPNVVGEAMACAVPCIVTDVGDSAEVVGSRDQVIDAPNVESITSAMKRLLSLSVEELEKLGEAARKRVRERYSLDVVRSQYVSTLADALSGRKSSRDCD